MEKTLQEAIRKAKAYGIPIIVYCDVNTNNIDYCSIEVYTPKDYNPIYIILSDGSFEKIGTANVHHG